MDISDHKSPSGPFMTRKKVHEVLKGERTTTELTLEMPMERILMFLSFEFISQKKFRRIKTLRDADEPSNRTKISASHALPTTWRTMRFTLGCSIEVLLTFYMNSIFQSFHLRLQTRVAKPRDPQDHGSHVQFLSANSTIKI
jgi:hypothetical protein